jgi:rhomboid protease GluP
MTGMIHGSRQGDICPACKHTTSLKDWTCPGCGHVLDGYLFGTVTPKSVAGADKDAFWAGYEACMSRWKETGSLELGEYRPTSGYETSYRAGWQYASDKIEAKGERKRGRRRGLQLLGSGALLTVIGGTLVVVGVPLLESYLTLGAGVLSLVLGTVSLITGKSDAEAPEPPGTVSDSSVSREPADVLNPVKAFHRSLRTSSPSIFVTWVVLALNILVFLAMLVAGLSLTHPTTASLIQWGADFGPRTTAGEWWRLLTSMFLHIGVIHIVFNMFALMQIGPLIERLLGKIGFGLVYLVAGLAGSLTSLASHPYLVSAGASGAIFGLYGAFLGFLALQRNVLPPDVLAPLMKGAMVFIGYNVIYGLSSPNTDMAAHVGGLAGGLLCGLALSMPLNALRTKRGARNAMVASAAAAVLVALAGKLPRAIDVQASLKQFAALEARTAAKFSDVFRRFHAQKTSGATFAAMVATQVLPEWIAEHDALARVHGLPFRQSEAIRSVVRYMELRRDGWLAMAATMEDGRREKFKESLEKQRKANDELKEFLRSLKSN